MQLFAVILVVPRPLRFHVLVNVPTLCVFNPCLEFVQIDETIAIGVNLVDDHAKGKMGQLIKTQQSDGFANLQEMSRSTYT